MITSANKRELNVQRHFVVVRALRPTQHRWRDDMVVKVEQCQAYYHGKVLK